MTKTKTDIDRAAEKCRRIARKHPDATWWWCPYHGDHVLKMTLGEVLERIETILRTKPRGELVCRLNILRPVLHPRRLPRELVKALAVCDEARDARSKAWAAFYDRETVKTNAAYVKAVNAHFKADVVYRTIAAACEPRLAALHNEEWPDNTWNGSTIFGKKGGEDGE